MSAKPLPNTGAVSGLKETLDSFGDPGFAQRRFETYGDVFATKLLAQPIVFIRGERAISDLFSQSESLEGWWPESVKQLLGSRSLANRSGAAVHSRCAQPNSANKQSGGDPRAPQRRSSPVAQRSTQQQTISCCFSPSAQQLFWKKMHSPDAR